MLSKSKYQVEQCSISHDIIAQFLDHGMLDVTNLNYASTQTIVFQRLTVIITDFLLAYAIKE